jgi:mono/diheme cytochrome c family protein
VKSPPSVIVIATVLVVPLSLAQNPKAQEDQPTRSIDSIQGSALYRAYCAVCHGSETRGSGPMAKPLKKAPTDLTRIAARNGGAFPLARVRGVHWRFAAATWRPFW